MFRLLTFLALVASGAGTTVTLTTDWIAFGTIGTMALLSTVFTMRTIGTGCKIYHIGFSTSQKLNRDYVGYHCTVGRVWRIGKVNAFRPKGHGFDSRSSRHVRTLDKSFTRNCLWRFGVKLRHSIHAVSGAPLSNSGLEETLWR